MGRSFRTHLGNRVIAHGDKAFTLFAQVEQHGQPVALGLQKSRTGDTLLKIGGRPAEKLAQLAEILPLSYNFV